MLPENLEHGSIRTPAILVAAVALLGGAAYVMSGHVPTATGLQDSPKPRAGFVAQEAPKVAESVKKAEAPANSELAKVKKGEVIQYRDHNGDLRYRLRDPVVGKTGTGQPLYFQLEFRPSNEVLTKAPGDKMTKADHKKKSLSPPHVKLSNGKLVTQPATNPAGDGKAGKDGG